MTLGTYRCLLQLRLWLCEPIVVAVIKNEQSIYIKKEIIGLTVYCCDSDCRCRYGLVAVVTLLLWFESQWILSEKNFATKSTD